jgi:hypothetical protein
VDGDHPTLRERIRDAGRRLHTGAASTAVGIVRNLATALRGFGNGVGGLVGGNVRQGVSRIGLSAVVVLQTPVDALLMAGGAVVSAFQTLLGVEAPGRKLRPAELAILAEVYGTSIDLDRIRIKEGTAGLLTLPNRPFTHGDTIYIPKRWLPIRARLLVHEAAHVWQHQNGGTDYMSESLFAQYLGDGYDYAKALRQGKRWAALNPEQQAEVIETAFARDLFRDPGARFIEDGTDYTDRLRPMLTEMRAGRRVARARSTRPSA